jgi:hypothetical protein
MLIVGALACLIVSWGLPSKCHHTDFASLSQAAIILSASVTFITLPGIDDVSRVAGFIAILLSASSLISAVIALFRFKSDIENPIAYPRGEGLVLLSVCIICKYSFLMLIWIRTEATKRPSLSSLGIFALRNCGIHYRDHIVCFPRVDDDNRWTPL